MVLVMASCNNSRRVVPFDMDTDEIFKPIEGEETTELGIFTFGKSNIPGFVIDDDLETDNPDIFINFTNVTILDVNAKINQNIFEFITDILSEYGFINENISLPDNEITEAVTKGATLTDIASHMVNFYKTNFDAQMDTIASYKVPFNAYFSVYPFFLDKDVVTYKLAAYCYTGGAHGINITDVRSYDLESGSALTFENIVKAESVAAVREEVAARMAYAYPIYEDIKTVPQYIDSLNVWLNSDSSEDATKQITAQNFPIEDVAISKEGLLFVYQMYDLTPGSDGCPVVLVPYKDIKGCVNEKYLPD